MSRFSASLLFGTGLLLTTVLATMPSKLNAATDPELRGEQLVAVDPPLQPAPARKNSTSQPPASQQLLPAAASGAASTPRNSPASGTVPAAKPSVAATDPPAVENVINLVLKLKQRRVYVYQGEKLIRKYPVAIGKKGWETPTGEWQVMEKIRNPAWTSFKTGEVFPPGTQNPLGARWIGFWTDGRDVIGFHGTANLKSIGKAASHGCVRMRNRDVRALFPLVKVGTTVKVIDE
ncbi:L,D-transpeptidase family protein [Chamaesiphon sp.]|uniref:L,D-transpeptidase n=1 Tax=Chamaesiphon sp. TaxID=2814140 RepID=UPI003593CD6C